MSKKKLILLSIVGSAILYGCSSAPTKKISTEEESEIRNLISRENVNGVKALLDSKGDISSESYLLDYSIGGNYCKDEIVDYFLNKGITPTNSQSALVNKALDGGCYDIAKKISGKLSADALGSSLNSYETEANANVPVCCRGDKNSEELCAVQAIDEHRGHRGMKPVIKLRTIGERFSNIAGELCLKDSSYCPFETRIIGVRNSYESKVATSTQCNVAILAERETDRENSQRALTEYFDKVREEAARQEREAKERASNNPEAIRLEACRWNQQAKLYEELLKAEKKVAQESGVTHLGARFRGTAIKQTSLNMFEKLQSRYKTLTGKSIDLNSCP